MSRSASRTRRSRAEAVFTCTGARFRHYASSCEGGLEEALFDYLACQRVADAYRAKRGARDADRERLRKAFEMY